MNIFYRVIFTSPASLAIGLAVSTTSRRFVFEATSSQPPIPALRLELQLEN